MSVIRIDGDHGYADYECPEDLCGYCGDSGGIHDGDSWGSCPECKGVGRVEVVEEPLSSYGSQADMAAHLRAAFEELQERCRRIERLLGAKL